MEKFLTGFVASFLIVAVWLFSGLRGRYLPFLGLAAVVLLVLTLTTGHMLVDAAPVRSTRTWWLRDLFFWSGLLFLLYLGIQWWNAGRELYYNAELERWAYTAPRHPDWPWAFTRREALEMLYWFFPAWVLGLTIRTPGLSRQSVIRIFRWLSYSAALLAIFGLVQYLSGTNDIFWTVPIQNRFFASFPYANHAAAYFVLLGGVTAGFFLREVFRPADARNRKRAWSLGLALALSLMGANLSLSRTGIFLAWLLASFISGYAILRGWKLLRPAARLIWSAATLAVFVSLFLAVAIIGRDGIRQRFTVDRRPRHALISSVETINLDLSVRPVQWRTGWSVFKEEPLFGVGGWGFRYMAPFHVPPEYIASLQYRSGGWANVHCDPIQFLAEFGLVGCGLMLLTVGVLLAACLRRNVRQGAVFTLSSGGLLLVFGFSLIDLPFRCPAVLWTWVAVTAALPKCAGAGRREEPGNIIKSSPDTEARPAT